MSHVEPERGGGRDPVGTPFESTELLILRSRMRRNTQQKKKSNKVKKTVAGKVSRRE
jgi:hypothetical protein